ncbi:MAG: HNH endonuclease [Bacteriovoracaceae bacterium]|nr:HNH endonuclease [Bacteriovoracaceae bacterium]
MKKKLILAIIFVITSTEVFSDCRGCCSRHKGVVCSQAGVTQCGDGTSLSSKCRSKKCNKCSRTSIEVTVARYNRKLYRHWIDKDGDCQNERAETLIRHNIGQLKFKTKKQCMVIGGKWIDNYSGKIFTKANELDIDHVVTLKHAHKMGANNWNKKQKMEFANDPDNLLPVWKKLNRQKGAKGPTKWLPPNKSFHCTYFKKWNEIKSKYKLKQAKREIASISELSKSCDLK